MPSTYSTSLRLELMATGEKTNTWGTITNTNLGTLLESAIAGVASVTHDDSANYSLTTNNGSDDEARHMVIEVGGTLTAARNLVVPTAQKLYFVKNNTSGGFKITVKTSGGSGIDVYNGNTAALYCDGTNVVPSTQQVPGGTRFVSHGGNEGLYFNNHTLTGSNASSLFGADSDINTTGSVAVWYNNIKNTASAGTSSLWYVEDSAGASGRQFEITLSGFEVRAGTGSASTPAFSFAGETNTGMFRSAANRLGFSVAGTARATLDADELKLTRSGLTAVSLGASFSPKIRTQDDDGSHLVQMFVNSGTPVIEVAGGGPVLRIQTPSDTHVRLQVRDSANAVRDVVLGQGTGSNTTANGTLQVEVGGTTYYLLTAASLN